MLFDPLAVATELPGAAAAVVAFRAGGRLHATIIAKATFAFAPDAPMPRVEPQPILRGEVYDGDNPLRGVRFTSDLVPYLGRADVLFTGHGYTSASGPVQSMAARLSIHTSERKILDKTLLLRDPSGFQKMPIVYKRAFGGPSVPDNPIGVGAPPNTDEPTIVFPDDPTRPAGFGPISRAWPARKRLLGETSRRALEQDIAEIPAGFDGSYFQAAPPDQRIDFLRGDEWIVLEGLYPSLPRLSTRLPGARGMARLYGLGASGMPDGKALDLCIDTLRIDGDEQRCTIVCRAWIPLADEAALAALRVTAGVLLAGETIEWNTPPPPRMAMAMGATRKEEPVQECAGTIALPDGQEDAASRRPALPFDVPRAVAPAPSPIAPPPPPLLAPMLPFSPPPPSAVAASNAAISPLPPLPLDVSPGPAPGPLPASAPKRAIDLVFFDKQAMPRVRKNPAWRRILEALQDKPVDPDIDDPELEIEPAAAEERREIFEVLAHADALGEDALRGARASAVRADGRFVPPLVLLEGELSISFDTFETLKATVAVFGQMTGADDPLKGAVAAGRDFLQGLDPLSDPVAAEALRSAIEETYTKGKRPRPLGELTRRLERVLLENRRYQRRAVFGGRYLRGSLEPKGTEVKAPAYLPESLADLLPMFSRFPARILAEVHLPVEEQEEYPAALRGVAIARIF